MTDPKSYPIENESTETIAAKVEFGRQIRSVYDAKHPPLRIGIDTPNDTTILGSDGQAIPVADEHAIEPQMETEGWIGVDLDGTLAQYDHYRGSDHIGAPVVPMLKKVLWHLEQGHELKIFTARVSPAAITANAKTDEEAEDQLRKVVTAIVDWCIQFIGRPIAITHSKDYRMMYCYDDRCVQMVTNQGVRSDGKPL